MVVNRGGGGGGGAGCHRRRGSGRSRLGGIVDNFTTIRASAVSTVTALIRGPRRYSCDTVVSVITQSMQSTVALDRILISWRDFYEWLEFKFYKAAFLGKTRNPWAI